MSWSWRSPELTAETIATFLIVREWLTSKLGSKANERIAVVTSAGKGDLKQLATAENYETFHLPIMSADGSACCRPSDCLPAALAGFDVRKSAKGRGAR